MWHSSLTFEKITDIERVQKNALRIILKENYETYALTITGLECLVERREQLCLKFAKACLKNQNVCDMFPHNPSEHLPGVRDREEFYVSFARTERLKKSAIPHMTEAAECQQMMATKVKIGPLM